MSDFLKFYPDPFALSKSVADGLIDVKHLALAGDGTPVRTAAQQRKKRICDCHENGIRTCNCKRRYSQPDCNWGWDSHRKKEYDRRTSVERSNKREKKDYLSEDGRHRSTKMWYCRLYGIMMLQHLDAWKMPPIEAFRQSLLSLPA